MPDAVDAAISAGDYERAAMLCEESGDFARAGELYSKTWLHEQAARAFAKANMPVMAIESASRAKNDELIAAIAEGITNEQDLHRGIDALETASQWLPAAKLAERAEQYTHAATLFERAGAHFDAAQLWHQAGQPRKAGLAAEAFLRTAEPADETVAKAHMLLGNILYESSDLENAVLHYQKTSSDWSVYASIARRLILAFVQLGYREAARQVLLSVRAKDESFPARVEDVVDTAEEFQVAEQKSLLGRYEIINELGSGAAGVVYEARDNLKGQVVAVKRFYLTPQQGGEAYERFLRESEIASRLNHPNIVEMFDSHVAAGVFSMEFVRGGALGRVERDALTDARVRDIAIDVCRGLRAAHQAGVVHRDLKPANIFLDKSGRAKIGDFGIAHILDLGQTQTGGLIGTLAYMSPEQITAAPIGPKADYYALGISLFEILTGRLPFQGPDFIAQHMTEQPPLPSSLGTPVHWDSLIVDLLQKSPSQRPASLDDIIERLASLPVLSTPLGSVEQPAAQNEEVNKPEERAKQARYQHLADIRSTAISKISRGLDTVLSRTVVIEEFNQQPDPQCTLLDLFRVMSPFVQRTLSFAHNRAIFEAPRGLPLNDVAKRLSPLLRVRIAKRLTRALSTLEESGATLDGLSADDVVLSEDLNPTILVAGRGRFSWARDSQKDLDSLVSLIRELVPESDDLGGALTTDAIDKPSEIYWRLESAELEELAASLSAQGATPNKWR